MKGPEDKSPAEVLRAKRLEIVDDEGKVRAALGTDEKGVASLSIFDSSGRLRVTVDASAAPEKGGGLSIHDTNGAVHVGLGVYEDGQAELRFAAQQTDQAIQMGTMDDGRVYLILSKKRDAMVILGIHDEDGNNPSSMLAVTDKEGRSGIEIRGRRFSPHVTLRDRRKQARASLALGANGEPGLFIFDEEGKPVQSGNAFEGLVAERGPAYQALLFGSVLVAGGVGGMWIASTASAASGSLTAAVVTVVVLAFLVGWLIVIRRRR